MDVWLLSSAYLTGLIMPDVYRICQPLLVGFIDCLGRDAVYDAESAVATNVVVDWSLLPWDPANRHEFVELGPLDHISLVTVIGVADAFLESC
ncbi:uncharacterized protein METZ01_LOCUS74351 [marine metagenome]|uniref:Uncharacterized protein n=1 Tax=marine metagenome TaxID=408172 RepID=A0A381U2H3_9ZZZZ